MGLIVRSRRQIPVQYTPPKDPLDQLLTFFRDVGVERIRPWIANPKRRRRFAEAVERLARLLEDGIPAKAGRAQVNPFPHEDREVSLNDPQAWPQAPFSHVRFYASLRPLRLECPRCGHILLLAYSQSHYDRYDPVSGILRCTCKATFQLGLIAWPVENNRHRKPIDQQLSYRQIAELRALTGGFWAERKKGQGEPANLYVPEGCSCPSPREPDAACPVHGQPPAPVEPSDG